MALVANDEAKLHFLHLEPPEHDKSCCNVKWNVKRTDLIQAAQEHFIADDQDAVERRQYKVFYPVVLRTVTKRIAEVTEE